MSLRKRSVKTICERFTAELQSVVEAETVKSNKFTEQAAEAAAKANAAKAEAESAERAVTRIRSLFGVE